MLKNALKCGGGSSKSGRGGGGVDNRNQFQKAERRNWIVILPLSSSSYSSLYYEGERVEKEMGHRKTIVELERRDFQFTSRNPLFPPISSFSGEISPSHQTWPEIQ